MDKKILACCIAFLFFQWTHAQAHRYSLEKIIEIAQQQSIQAKLNENVLKNRYYQFYTYKSNLRPQLSLDGNFPQYSKQYAPVIQPDGTQKYLPRYYNTADVGLSLYQEIPLTGGSISLFSGLNRFDDLNLHTQQYNSVPVRIMLTQPLFAFNSWKWEKMIEPLKYKEAQKQYAEDMADIAIQATALYFNVLIAQINLHRDSGNLINNQSIYAMEQKRVDLATTSMEKLLQIRLQVLRSIKAIRQVQFDMQTAQQNLKAFLGFSNKEDLALLLPGQVPEVQVDTARALAMARKFRPEFTGFMRQMMEAQRDVDQAQKSRFQINLNASFGWNNAANEFPAAYQDLKNQQVANIGFSIPILDWGRRKYRVESALANEKVTRYTLSKEKINFEQKVRTALANFNLLKNSIPIAKETDSIAQLRYQLALQQYQTGNLSITDLNIALSEKDNAAGDYLQVLNTFWQAYYQLRKLTLFDFENDKPLEEKYNTMDSENGR